MEKLIKLLNEYNKEKTNGGIGWREWKYDDEFGNLLYGNYNGGTFSEMYCISKRYGFIDWLVKEDKIDRDNQALQYAKSDLAKFFTEWKDKNGMSDDCTMLLMLLAIQDKPIDFLCEIIKN